MSLERLEGLNLYDGGLRNFVTSEFECKCGCGGNVVHHLVDLLQAIRDEAGVPIIVTSAYRCEAHNSRVGGKPGSMHTFGRAVDVALSHAAAYIALSHVYRRGSSVTGLGLRQHGSRRYMHIDVHPRPTPSTRPVPRCWTYE